MANISENLQTLNEAKLAIKAAIEAKGQDLTNIPFTGYASQLENLFTVLSEYEEKYNIIQHKFMQTMGGNFGKAFRLTQEDLAGCENIMNYAFYTRNLSSIDIPSSVVRIGGSVFAGCTFPKWEGETDEDMNLNIPDTVVSVQNWLCGNSGLRKAKICRPSTYTVGMNEASYNNWFTNCNKLEYLEMTNIRWDLQVGSGNAWGHLLKKECLIKLCQECISSDSLKTLTVGSENLNKLVDVYVRLLEDDGSGKVPCEICESADENAMLISEYMVSKNWQLA